MKKLQILLPEPMMRQLKARARLEDRPMSELIRRATEQWLHRLPERPSVTGARPQPTTHRLGVKIDDPSELKSAIYDRNE